ncbi:hypothetical protein TNCV_4925441 [Trichonephila clavipes]|nr:hypothetical protein TNCV_4925441 [Trichonephila clavipes]
MGVWGLSIKKNSHFQLQQNVVYPNVYYPERQISGPVFYETSFAEITFGRKTKKKVVAAFVEKLNMKDACYMFAKAWDSLERQSLKNSSNKLWPDLKGEKDLNADRREVITDFVQSIPGFQECDEQIWMACDAENCGLQMLNEDEIVTSVQEEFNSVDNETDEDKDNNNNESSKGPSNSGAFSALETAMEWYEQQSECCPTKVLLLKRNRDLFFFSE